jgi:hypothetical protein
VPYYAPIIEAYNTRPVAGSAAYVKTPKKKKGKKSIEDILKGLYLSKINFKSSSKKGAATQAKQLIVKGWSTNDSTAFRDTAKKLFLESKI